MLKKVLLLVLVLFIFLSFCVNADTLRQPVKVLEVKGVINPIVASYVSRGIERAESDNSICIIKMDTPGGLDKSMREIINKILNTHIPVVVYVCPDSARAASAGVYILYASHLAAMAPTTNLGSAHPVMMGGGDKKESKTMTEKITNDAVAHIKALAEKRNRNEKWAEEAVRKSVSVKATDAKKLGIIEIIAPDLKDLLKQMKGRKVELPQGEITLNPDFSNIKEINMSFAEKFLFTITDPNIAFILMMLGIYGLIYEFASPGAIFPGVLGGICLLLALYALGTLPFSYTGIALILFAFILFIVDVKVPSHGLLTLGGVISLVLGSLILIPAGHPYLAISRSLIFAVALVTGLFFAFIVGAVVRGLRTKPVTGKEELVDAIGVARTDLNPEGLILVVGELWKARSNTGTIKEGSQIKVIKVRGLKLIVEETKEEDVV